MVKPHSSGPRRPLMLSTCLALCDSAASAHRLSKACGHNPLRVSSRLLYEDRSVATGRRCASSCSDADEVSHRCCKLPS